MFVEQGYQKQDEHKIDVTTLPYTLEGFIAWLETKNPDENYLWWSSQQCAVAQFRDATNQPLMTDLSAAFTSIDEYTQVGAGYRSGGRLTTLEDFERELKPGWTFGKCLERAKKVLAERKNA